MSLSSSSSSIPKPAFEKGEIINGSWKVPHKNRCFFLASLSFFAIRGFDQ